MYLLDFSVSTLKFNLVKFEWVSLGNIKRINYLPSKLYTWMTGGILNKTWLYKKHSVAYLYTLPDIYA